MELWPTPDASVANDGETLESWQARREREKAKGRNGNGFGTPLAVAVRLYPSPTSSMLTIGDLEQARYRSDNPERPTYAEANAGGGGLNPRWVEWLMGYPDGWTDCGDSETPSSRKSRKSSSG
jgi:hypothetical protein